MLKRTVLLFSERIHQAQGAAAKAKKSLQRPKTSKAVSLCHFAVGQIT